MSVVRWYLESVLRNLTTLDIKPVHTHTHTNSLPDTHTAQLHKVIPLRCCVVKFVALDN